MFSSGGEGGRGGQIDLFKSYLLRLFSSMSWRLN